MDIISFFRKHLTIAKESCCTTYRHPLFWHFVISVLFHNAYPKKDYRDYSNKKWTEIKQCPELIEIECERQRQKLAKKVLKRYTYIGQETIKRRKNRNKLYSKAFNMGDNCSIGYNVIIRKRHPVGDATIIMGHDVNLSRGVEIDYTGKVEIGNNVNIAQGTIILTHGHDFLGFKKNSDLLSQDIRLFATPLHIEDNVDIGTHCIILPGVSRIGVNAVISAGSVVTKEVPANSVVGGNPAIVLGTFPDEMKLFNAKNIKEND